MEIGGTDERKQIGWMDIAGCVSSCLSPVIDIILAILNSQYKILNLIIFVVLEIALFGGWNWWRTSFAKEDKRLEEAYQSRMKKLKNELEKSKAESESEESGNSYNKEIDELRKHNNGIRGKRNKIKGIMNVVFGLAMLFSFVMIGVQTVCIIREKGTKEVTSDGGSGTGINEGGVNIEISTLGNNIDDGGITSEQIEMMRNKKIILSDPDRTLVLSYEDEETVFYVTSTDPEICEIEVQAHIKDIYDQEKTSTFSEDSIEQATKKEAQTEEDIFINDINKALEYKTQENYEDWSKTVPSSDTLDKIIEKRERLWRPLEEDMEFNGDTCFRLANNYQLYADEYSAQGGKPETVIYDYVESIKWTERGLAYKEIVKDRDTYYKYLKARYKDIHDYIEKNSGKFGEDEEKYQEIKEKAAAIYKAM